MQSSSSSSPSFLVGAVLPMKNAFIKEIESNALLGPSFQSSFNPSNNAYEITPTDMPWLCQCKSLINAINIIEASPKLLTEIQNFLNKDSSKIRLGVTVARHASALMNLEYYLNAAKYYGAQESGDFLKIMPHLQGLSLHALELAKSFNVIEQMLNPAARELSNPEQTHLGQYLHTSLLKDEIGKMTDINSMKTFANNVVNNFKSDFVKFKEEINQLVQREGVIDALPGKDSHKEKMHSEMIEWYHMAESMRINYGIDTTHIEEQLSTQAKNLFGDDYLYWQYASADISLEQKQSESRRLQRIKEVIVKTELTHETDLNILFKVRSELKEIKSFDIRLYIEDIDLSINKRTNLHALNKEIDTLKYEHIQEFYKQNAEKSSSSSSSIASNLAMANFEEKLEKLEIQRDLLQSKINAIKSQASNEVFHYDKKTKSVIPGESKHYSKDPIVTKKNDHYKKALHAIDLALEANENQIASLHANKKRLTDIIATLPKDKEVIETKIASIKTKIIDTQRQKAQNSMTFSGLKTKAKKFSESIAPSSPQSRSEKFSIPSVQPFTDSIKKQIVELQRHLDANSQATLALSDHGKTAKINANDKPMVKLIKSSLNALLLLETNARRLQKMQARLSVSKGGAVAKIILSDFTNDLLSMPQAIQELQTRLDEIKNMISQSPARNMLNLPIFSQIENIMSPLQVLYQHLNPKNFTLSASSSSSVIASSSSLISLKEKFAHLFDPSAQAAENKPIMQQIIRLIDVMNNALQSHSVLAMTQALMQAKDTYKTLRETDINSADFQTMLNEMIDNFSAECEHKIVSVTDSLQKVLSLQHHHLSETLLEVREQNHEAIQQNLEHLKALEKSLGLSASASSTLAEKLHQFESMAASFGTVIQAYSPAALQNSVGDLPPIPIHEKDEDVVEFQDAEEFSLPISNEEDEDEIEFFVHGHNESIAESSLSEEVVLAENREEAEIEISEAKEEDEDLDELSLDISIPANQDNNHAILLNLARHPNLSLAAVLNVAAQNQEAANKQDIINPSISASRPQFT